MKTFIAIALAGLAVASAVDYEAKYAEFKARYNKTDISDVDRFPVFKANWDTVLSLNEDARKTGGNEVFGMSPFLDQTPAEFKGMHNMIMPAQLPEAPVHKVQGNAPKKLDWRNKGVLTAIKNQEQCGSCWAFSATESIESANAMAKNPLMVLAPEQIVDCSTQNDGCQGGNPTTAMQYVINAGGQELEKDYPYTAGGGQSGPCNFQQSKAKQTLRGWSYATQSQSETAMVDAMASKGPLSVCVDASQWQFYNGGIMNAQQCGGTQLDHAVQGVGYDTTAQTPYWVIRNSWGASWGEQGYIRITYNHDTCGVAQLVSYGTA